MTRAETIEHIYDLKTMVDALFESVYIVNASEARLERIKTALSDVITAYIGKEEE